MAGEYDTMWRPWPVWSAVFVGALAARKNITMLTTAFNIAGAFFAFVVDGWVAARIAGLRRAEPAMLHGAVTWLVALPMLLIFAAFGATGSWGGWYSALAGTPVWSSTALPPVTPETAAAMRNAATAAVVALLLGLTGSVLGGWMASGEPMSWTYYRRRDLGELERPRRVA